jgi:hypothetical protein
MGKMVVLKPVVWSPNGYKFPAGIERSGKDYVAVHGFGHEEWNGDPTRLWNGQRVFHTEGRGRMEEYGRTGNLAIIMTAYGPNGIGPHAVGVAANVSLNTKEEGVLIAEAIGAREHASAMWKLPSVKRRYPDLSAFETFWEGECAWIHWRCPPSHYEWFISPVKLDKEKLFPPTEAAQKSPHIVKMFSSYMPITQDQALNVVWNSLDEASPIVEWLRVGPFDDLEVAKTTKAYGKPSPSSGTKQHGSAPPAEDPYTRYVRTQEITVNPKHKKIQDCFADYIAANGGTAIVHDDDCVDIQFTLKDRGLVLAEVKPCNKSDARFAIRTAMGQLLDYQQRHQAKPINLLVVLEVKPTNDDIELALKNRFGVAYPRRNRFALEWPP